MNLFHPKDASMYIKEEFDQMQSKVSPFMKKSMIYGGLAFPLITISIFNLFFLLSSVSINKDTIVIFGLLALAGALGMAFFKELTHQNRRMHETSVHYIKERIAQSDQLPDYAKDRYLKEIRMNPANVFQTFYDFLKHEERIKNLDRS
ncbi:DUF5392 family protein [Alkalibacillus aidingensis]|uniref:DUF5392 family protein n=1 Tax=Alkalibacillus aidingensis TaxID=2747607 RepID=UPI001660C321|nr:DUF5392 family protein [Alkalibacillus aidingensis]